MPPSLRPWAIRAVLISLVGGGLGCSSDDKPGTTGSGGAGGRGGAGGARTGGSGGTSPGTGGSGTIGTGGNSGGGSGGSGGATAGTGGNAGGSGGSPADVGAGGGGGEAGSSDGPGGPASTFVYASSNSGYGAPSTLTVFKLDLTTGALTKGPGVAAGNNGYYLAFAPNKRFAYSLTETAPTTITAWSIDQSTGALTKVNSVSTASPNAAHLAVDPTGKWLAVAHYTGGNVTLHPLMDSGMVGAVADTKPAGDKAHHVAFDRSGGFVLVPALGANVVAQFKIEAGKLVPNTPPSVPVPGGPRHIVLDKAEANAYVVAEPDASIVHLKFDKASGKLSSPSAAIPANVTEKGGGSHILLDPTGKFLFVGSRFDNSILTFAINAATGAPTRTSNTSDSLAYPRDFDIDPSGTFLIAGTQNSNPAVTAPNRRTGGTVVVFKIDPADGKLTRTGPTTPLPSDVAYVGTLRIP